MAFYVGQKVVCVDASQPRLSGRAHPLVKRAIYTIAGTGLIHPFDPENRPCVSIVEMSDFRSQFGFWAHRFRPVVEKKTDISIFTAMLTPSTERVQA